MDENAEFLLYVGALLLTAVLLIGLAVSGVGQRAKSERVINGLIGLAAGGYAVYLISTVFISGGEYRRFIAAFILPFFAIFQIYKGMKARKAEQAQQAEQAAAGNPIQE